MSNTNRTSLGYYAGMVLMLCSFTAFATDGHIGQAIKHAESAANASDAKSVAEHAELAKTHVKTADEHLDAGAKSLDEALEHAKQGHTDLAKKAAEAAVVHLKAAQ